MQTTGSRAQTRPPTPARAPFGRDDGLKRELRARVHEQLTSSALRVHDLPGMYVKTAALLLWVAVSYGLLVFFATRWWHGVLLSFSCGLALAGIGFNVQHDAGHGAYSKLPLVNRLMAFTLDLMGGSSYLWRIKHNGLHHVYPNLAGFDDDIDLGFLARLSTDQPRHGFHRYQHVYLWLLYGFLAPKWHFVDDFLQLARGRIGRRRIHRPRSWDLALLVMGKAAFFAAAFGVPLMRHPPWVVASFYLLTAYVLGFTLSVVFQLAHCVDAPPGAAANGSPPSGWAEHQIRETVDFGCSRVLRGYLGGLNFQIEHHLFPAVCHLRYPDVARVVAQVCAERGLPYRVHRSVLAALRSHQCFLRRLGAG